MGLIDFGAALLRQLPAETAHDATLRLARVMGPFLPKAAPDDPRLAVSAFGLNFPNPLGLAAGFDKNAAVPDAMASSASVLSNAAPSRPGRRPEIRSRACSACPRTAR